MPKLSFFNPLLRFSSFKNSLLKLLALFCLTASLMLIALVPAPAQVTLVVPGQAASAIQDITFTPPQPQLGATISVVINATQTPTVKFAEKPYPAFQQGNNLWRSLIPTTPLDSPGTKNLTVGVGAELRTIPIVVRDRNFPTQRIWLPERDEKQPLDEYEFDRVDEFKAITSPERYWRGTLVRPVSEGGLTTGYGVRRYYNGVFAEDYYHGGLDYGVGVGTTVVAPAAGRIALVGRADQRFNIHGNVVGIDHGQGLLSIMLHLSRIDVREGDFVEAGQAIALSGVTGAVTGPHLHWGLFVNGKSIDPVPWREGDFN